MAYIIFLLSLKVWYCFDFFRVGPDNCFDTLGRLVLCTFDSVIGVLLFAEFLYFGTISLMWSSSLSQNFGEYHSGGLKLFG